MTAPELRQHLIETLRQAACDGECGDTEQECQLTRVQPEVWEHGVLVDVSGRVEVLVDVLLKELAPYLTDDADLTEDDIDRMMEQATADAYQRMISAPLSAEACAAIKRRLESGTMPRRTVRLRENDLDGQETTHVTDDEPAGQEAPRTDTSR